MSECSEELRLQGKAYPRTCMVCGLGPCRRGNKFTPEIGAKVRPLMAELDKGVDFNIGDVVKLKSFGAKMTINSVVKDPAGKVLQVRCQWHDKYGRPYCEVYSPKQLEHVPPEPNWRITSHGA